MYNYHVMPFFWLHGESEKELCDYLKVVNEMDIHAICLESRPHIDYLGEKWWKDLRCLIIEAKKRDMKVWILDDEHFPSGYGGGVGKELPDELKRWNLDYIVLDMRGPDREVKVSVIEMVEGHIAKKNTTNMKYNIVSVVMWRRKDVDSFTLTGEPIDLTDGIAGGDLIFKLEDGVWSFFIVYEMLGGAAEFNDYVNYLKYDSVKALVDRVYEGHYQNLGQYFGNTIEGFFSDEPGFYNDAKELFDYESSIGKEYMQLPWSDDMQGYLKKALQQNEIRTVLPALWCDAGKLSVELRYAYMNIITKLYQHNYVGQIGEWCQKHDVKYSGHVLEDENISARLGAGTGHYFRAMQGQDIAGVDVVLKQVMPGKNFKYRARGIQWDGEFYYYVLAQMGVSDAFFDKKKDGRALCEIFGAYGWSEGISLMKWLADFMLVRGINYFVPHGFSPKSFPDADCPPHFYAHGYNPQGKYMKYLFQYMNRMAELITNGRQIVNIGVLYHGEAEWCGEYELTQKAAHMCAKAMKNHVVVPIDYLVQTDMIRKNLEILLVPYSEYLPKTALAGLIKLAQTGIQIYFSRAFPSGCSDDREDKDHVLQRLKTLSSVKTLEEIRKLVAETGKSKVEIEGGTDLLRFYEYEKGDLYYCLIFNEGMKTLNLKLSYPHQDIIGYDAMKGEYFRFLYTKESGKIHFMKKILPGEIFVTVGGNGVSEKKYIKERGVFTERNLYKKWNVSTVAYDNSSQQKKIGEMAGLGNIEALAPNFAGRVVYETTARREELEDVLILEGAWEAVEVFMNNYSAGVCIGRPYVFDIGDLADREVNSVRIEAATTLFGAVHDSFSLMGEMKSCGIAGGVKTGKRL